TTYRHMAERVTDMAVKVLSRDKSLTAGPCMTRRIALARSDEFSGDENEATDASASFEVPLESVRHLMKTYGGNYRTVLEIAREGDELKKRLTDDLPHIAAEVVYAARHELAANVEDFLERRTRIALLTRDHGRSCSDRVRELTSPWYC
ncbi:MAG TPA: glycerol-3-phosphate dehydrogenase C-terminal domain-containing protein, partial [Blastocatellia bacterium]|nr:glycerol-3-phosphate dehydrogenase C-terminal domain-containing protein [Blastocatellia bacterium]